MEAISWKQKCREKWLKDGDKNTKYFHYLANHHRRSNYVDEILVDDCRFDGNAAMREAAKSYFQNLYSEDFHLRPGLDLLQFSKIDNSYNSQLEAEFSEEEILNGLPTYDGDKAPGPDSFNLKFLQEYWNVVKQDILDFFNDFHINSSFVKSLNSTFLVLIPKKKNAKQINESRPISLIGSIYNILSKVVATRLSKVLNSVIGENQQAFVHGIQITNAVLMANEIVDDVFRKKSQGILCKR